MFGKKSLGERLKSTLGIFSRLVTELESIINECDSGIEEQECIQHQVAIEIAELQDIKKQANSVKGEVERFTV